MPASPVSFWSPLPVLRERARGEGLPETARDLRFQTRPHPDPLPEYREREGYWAGPKVPGGIPERASLPSHLRMLLECPPAKTRPDARRERIATSNCPA